MKSNMPLNQLRHQSVERAATRCDQLQNVFAIALAFKGSFHGFNLALNPADPGEHFGFVLGGMGQVLPPKDSITLYTIRFVMAE